MRNLYYFIIIILLPAQLLSQVIKQDSLSLVDLYNDTNGSKWTNHNNWLTGPVSTWYGITVSIGRVSRIDLSNNNLSGTIPASIGNLDGLQYLNLGINHLTDKIPSELGYLTNLRTLYLYNNQLNGLIPSSLGNLSSLVNFNSGNNQLNGTIPPELGNLRNLQVLWLDTNRLSGTIPVELGNMRNLQDISLANNQLSGPTPLEFGNLLSLQYLNLSYNQLSNSIPAELGKLKNLRLIEFESNQLSGPVPSKIGNLGNLETLFLFANQLSGSIPQEIRNLSKLQRLWLQGNRFVDLPDLSSITNLVEMKIERNKFTFEDLEPNIGIATIFTYSPQDSLGIERDTTINEGNTLTLSISVAGRHNRYQWKKDGMAIPAAVDSIMTISKVTPADSGSYTCEITNTAATALTLYTRPINISVKEKVPIYVSCDTVQIAGNEFWVDINVGTGTRPVSNLFGVSFVLHYESNHVDVVSPYSDHVIPGDFLGDTSRVVFYSPELPGDSINVGISRKSGDSNVSGCGTIVKVKFRTSTQSLDSTRIRFYFTSVTAKDSAWNLIGMSPKETYVTILQPRVMVWPGDTNNDGIVNQADVLPIGLAMGFTGPVRPNASLKWIGQPCLAWTPVRATYADATGNGIVESSDIIGIKINWGKTISLKKSMPEIISEINGRICPVVKFSENKSHEFYVEIHVEKANDLFGIAFDLKYPHDKVDILSIEPGNCWSSDRLLYHHNDKSNGSLAIAISQKAGQDGLDENLKIAVLKVKSKTDYLTWEELKFEIINVAANISRGEYFSLVVENATLNSVPFESPKDFQLYQNYPNPFNMATKISYTLPSENWVKVSVFNLLGQEVRTLVDMKQNAGWHTVHWNGRNNNEEMMPSGIYLVKMKAGHFTARRKMILAR